MQPFLSRVMDTLLCRPSTLELLRDELFPAEPDDTETELLALLVPFAEVRTSLRAPADSVTIDSVTVPSWA